MEDKAKGEATVRRLFLLYAAMFALGAAVMAAKHRPASAVLFLGCALVNSVGVALYFRFKAKRR